MCHTPCFSIRRSRNFCDCTGTSSKIYRAYTWGGRIQTRLCRSGLPLCPCQSWISDLGLPRNVPRTINDCSTGCTNSFTKKTLRLPLQGASLNKCITITIVLQRTNKNACVKWSWVAWGWAVGGRRRRTPPAPPPQRRRPDALESATWSTESDGIEQGFALPRESRGVWASEFRLQIGTISIQYMKCKNVSLATKTSKLQLRIPQSV